MKALVKKFDKKGLWLEQISKPAYSGNDVLIKIHKTSICGTDLHIYNWDEWAQKNVRTPMQIGHEFVGEIVETGRHTVGFKKGDRVSGEGHLVCGQCRNCRAGARHLCIDTRAIGVNRPGCFAEYLSLPASNLFLIPPGITDDEAAILDPLGNAVHTTISFDLIGEDILISGAGPIGMEFATIWSRYGAKVTVVEMLPHVLPLEDEAISIEARRQFKRARIQVRTGTRVERIVPTDGGADVEVSADGESEVISAEKVLVAIGFIPNSDDLGLERVGVKTSRGNIDIDDQMRTGIPGIYAVGDVTGKLGLAHAASAQGMTAAEAIAGNPTRPIDYTNIPRCTYSHPEVASVGLTEQAAREQGLDVETATYPFLANGKALAMDDNKGFVKIICASGSRRLLGVHMIGAHVTELIAGPTGMITLESTAEQLAHTVYPHPTVGEAVMEAAHMLVGQAIHM